MWIGTNECVRVYAKVGHVGGTSERKSTGGNVNEKVILSPCAGQNKRIRGMKRKWWKNS